MFVVLVTLFAVQFSALCSVPTVLGTAMASVGYSQAEQNTAVTIFLWAGIAAAMVTAPLVDKLAHSDPRWYKFCGLASSFITFVGILIFSATLYPSKLGLIYFASAVTGGGSSSALPTLIEAGAEVSFPYQRDSAGLLLMVGNILGFVTATVMKAIAGHGYRHGFYLYCVVNVIALALFATMFKVDGHKSVEVFQRTVSERSLRISHIGSMLSTSSSSRCTSAASAAGRFSTGGSIGGGGGHSSGSSQHLSSDNLLGGSSSKHQALGELLASSNGGRDLLMTSSDGISFDIALGRGLFQSGGVDEQTQSARSILQQEEAGGPSYKLMRDN